MSLYVGTMERNRRTISYVCRLTNPITKDSYRLYLDGQDESAVLWEFENSTPTGYTRGPITEYDPNPMGFRT